MKIVLTGGGTGGHFYPVIAVAESIRSVEHEEKLIHPELYYLAPEPYDKKALFNIDINYRHVAAGKVRLYPSIKNFFDVFKTAWGIISAMIALFSIYPDVVFAKGGYASFPTLFAAYLYGIPVVIHESDTTPGRVNSWAGKFAKRIAVSYPEAAEHFPEDSVAYTGQPIREEILYPAKKGAYQFLDLAPDIPVIFITGGSQGAEIINDTVIEALPNLLEDYQIIHQTGPDNLEAVQQLARVTVEESGHSHRYRTFGFLNPLALRMAAGAADVIVSRAGSTIFEIATWGVPSIIIPIRYSNNDHQRKNAFAYARTGAAEVIEESNLTDDILITEIREILSNKTKHLEMSEAAESFARTDASQVIAQEIVNIALQHER